MLHGDTGMAVDVLNDKPASGTCECRYHWNNVVQSVNHKYVYAMDPAVTTGPCYL